MGSEFVALELANIENNCNNLDTWHKVEESWNALMNDFDSLYKIALEVRNKLTVKEIEKNQKELIEKEEQEKNREKALLLEKLSKQEIEEEKKNRSDPGLHNVVNIELIKRHFKLSYNLY